MCALYITHRPEQVDWSTICVTMWNSPEGAADDDSDDDDGGGGDSIVSPSAAVSPSQRTPVTPVTAQSRIVGSADVGALSSAVCRTALTVAGGRSAARVNFNLPSPPRRVDEDHDHDDDDDKNNWEPAAAGGDGGGRRRQHQRQRRSDVNSASSGRITRSRPTGNGGDRGPVGMKTMAAAGDDGGVRRTGGGYDRMQPRRSLLGKPINYRAHRRDARYRRLQHRIYNFLERPKDYRAISYHLLV